MYVSPLVKLCITILNSFIRRIGNSFHAVIILYSRIIPHQLKEFGKIFWRIEIQIRCMHLTII